MAKTKHREEERHACLTGNHLAVTEIGNWQEFHEIVAGPEYRNWAFRGQSNADWPLYSSLSRYLKQYGIHRDAWAAQEERIGRIFQRKAHLYLDHVPRETDSFQWLALMQHHGAPTRLLDFTWSPFVAAFFALERATRDAAVWAIFIPAIWRVGHGFPQRKARLKPEDIGLRREGAYQKFSWGIECLL